MRPIKPRRSCSRFSAVRVRPDSAGSRRTASSKRAWNSSVREALRAYCAAGHLPFALDPTNLDERYRRNAVRSALGGLRDQFPHLDAAVARCARILAEERAEAPAARARERLRAELVASQGNARDLTFERLDAVARALETGRPGRHHLRRGVTVVVE